MSDNPVADVENPVTIVFTDGSELDVKIAARLVGAEWMWAYVHTDTDEEEGVLETDEIILRTPEIRYIRCDSTFAPNSADTNTRIHCGENRDPESAKQELFELHKAQHQLHPDDDPSAFEMSEQQWPPVDPEQRDLASERPRQ